MESKKPFWMRNKSSFLGTCMLLFSLVLFFLIIRFPNTATQYRTVAPTFFPYLLSAILAGLSLLLIGEGRRSAPGPLFSIEFNSRAAYRTGLLLLILIIFALTLTTLGFTLAAMLFMLAGQLLLGERKMMPLVLYTLAVPWGMYLVFAGLFKIPLPMSPWF
jgi:putative tricarboxylic transport membrane protein